MIDQKIDYELIDSGNERRLERFGETIINRPAPQAFWHRDSALLEWKQAAAYYERPENGENKWTKDSTFPENWTIQIENITLELRPSENNQLGIFPEQLDNWRWMTERIKEANRPLQILNTFAYTGIATLMASAAGENVEVCHVDGAKSAVSWARKNAELSGLEKNKIRWIVDDVVKFMEREVKRGKKYDGIILDPPAFGRGAKGTWKIERDLPHLLELANTLLSETPCFVILSCHAVELTAENLAQMLEEFSVFKGKKAEAVDLIIPSEKGNELPSSVCGRIAS
jgi:23S rRNA (cytosine1962-C5)-methyltransferase